MLTPLVLKKNKIKSRKECQKLVFLARYEFKTNEYGTIYFLFVSSGGTTIRVAEFFHI